MQINYDVVIIGGGVSGTTLAYQLAANKLKIAVIENDLWGGTCPNRGCDPKSILIAGVSTVTNFNNMENNGVSGQAKIDWPSLMEHKRNYTNQIPNRTEQGLLQSGITTYHNAGHFIDANSFLIGDDILMADRFVIATGQRPRTSKIVGQEYLLNSNGFLDLDELPNDITFIGGGYLGFELAAIANAAGAKVHLIHHNDRPLKEYDPEMVDNLIKCYRNSGIEIILDTDITQVAKKNNQYVLTGQDFSLTTDLVFATLGRVPNIENLGLQQADVNYDNKGIIVNDSLQTTNPKVYAVGDVISRNLPKLTPVATYDGDYLSKLFMDNNEPIKYPAIPTIIFGQPALAQVGRVSTNADDSKIECIENDMTNWLSYKRMHTKFAKAKIYVEKSTQEVVGATIISDQADYLINIFTIMINNHATVTEIDKYIFTYPTLASDIKYLI